MTISASCVSRAALVAGLGLLIGTALPASAADDAKIEAVAAAVSERTGGKLPDSVKPTPMAGVYEVLYGTEILYVSSDGRYVLRGDMVDLETRENLTEDVRRVSRKSLVEKIDEKSMIIYVGAGAKAATPERTVTVFTDVDCGYCAKLHSEMDDYNARGITIRYLAFPRAGIPSKSYTKTVSVWCSDDQRKAITIAKAGGPVADASCENPVESHYNAGRDLGVRGTPTMVLSDGTVLPGYLPPERLEQVLNGESS